MKNTRVISRFYVLLPMYFVALCLILAMASMSVTDRRIHPDELDHAATAKFYIDNWLPPAVADPRTLGSYSNYGFSYHGEWDIVYFLAGKFAWVISPLVSDEVYAFRLFNVFLFFVLSCFALVRCNNILLFSALLMSPQIWYIFSYFNADSFPMFLSVLVVYEIGSSRSILNAYKGRLIVRLLPVGILLGLLVLSKKTFWLFAVFAAGCLCGKFLYLTGRTYFLAFLKQCMVLAMIIAGVALPRIGYDLYVNGTPSHKSAMAVETAELLAQPEFKPSSVGSGKSHQGFKLRSHGISMVELLQPPWLWEWTTLCSSFGVYQYMSDGAGIRYYIAIGGVYFVFLCYLSVVIKNTSETHGKSYISWAFSMSVAIVAVSLYHSWIHDFQPQGRYLFAIFCIFSAVLERYRESMNPMIVNLFFAACFFLSTYSYVFIALKHIPKA